MLRIKRSVEEPAIPIPREVEDASRDDPAVIDTYCTQWVTEHPDEIAAHRAACQAQQEAAESARLAALDVEAAQTANRAPRTRRGASPAPSED